MLTEKPLNRQVLLIRIPEARPHLNADSLELLDILGYQVVVKKGQFKAGELAVYIQPDSVVPQTTPFRFLWADYLKRPEMCPHVTKDGSSAVLTHSLAGTIHEMCLLCRASIINRESSVPARRRRITVRKFRKEWSEGLLMPLMDFPALMAPLVFSQPISNFPEGADVSDVLGITHYEAEEEDTRGPSATAPKRKARRPNNFRGWLRYFYFHSIRFLSGGRAYRQETSMDVPFDAPEYEVAAMKAARTGFVPNEQVIVTEKLHGSNARYLYLDGTMYVGSHYQWKAPGTPNIFNRALQQHPWIKEWCESNEGRTLYGEIVGDQKGYTYGLDKAKGELDFRAFDIWEPNGSWTKPWTESSDLFNTNSTKNVPILYSGVADMDKIKALTDGMSKIDGKTQREGIVVSELYPAPEGIRRPRQLKRVSNIFLDKDSK